MTRFPRALTFTTQALLIAIAAAGCDVPPTTAGSDPGADKEAPVQLTAALTDPFVTPAQPSLATAVGSDRVFDVWLADTTVGRQVVGQMFSFTGAPLGPSRVYTNTGHEKFSPSIAYNGAGKFLVTYGDRYSQTDDDILGLIVDSTGALVSSIQVDFTTNFDQQASVIYVGGLINQWLVTYQRSPDTGNRSVLSVYISAAGARGLSGTIMTDPNLPITPQAAYSTATARLLYTWTLGSGDLQFRGSSTAFGVGGVSTVPLAVGHMYEYQSLVYQPNLGEFALAWFEEEPFIDNGRAVRLRTLPQGCEKLACANAEQPTMITTSATITEVDGPRLTAAGSFFVIHSGQAGPNLPNGRNIKLTALNASGVVSSITTSSVPSCSTTLTDKLGLQYYLQASSNAAADHTNIVYDTYCPTTNKIRGQLVSSTLGRTNYAVSD